MPRIPRDCGAKQLVGLLRKYGYEVARQTGSHMRLYSGTYDHSITIPSHNPIKIGTLSAILAEVSATIGIDKARLTEQL